MEDDIRADLLKVLPADRIVTDPQIMDAYSRDQATWAPHGRPAAVVRAGDRAQVVATLKEAFRTGRPVVTRAAGSGLSGGANAIDGCIVLSVADINEIVEINDEDQLAVVNPGVINGDLKRAVADRGLWYPPDPASYEFSTIGGNVATNAGGLCCMKYGVTREYVLGLEAVMANGDIIRVGRRTVKGVAGYDLTALMVGSEGTLAVITEIVLRLRPAPHPSSTVAAFFPTTLAAGRAVGNVIRAGLTPSLLEIMDRTTIEAIDDWKRMDLDRHSAAMLFAQTDALGEGRTEETRLIEEAFRDAGATYAVSTTDPGEGEMLLQARRLAYPALERLGATILDDVGVPRSQIPSLINLIDEISNKHQLLIGTFGHVGDGNMHPTIVFERGNVEDEARAQKAFAEILTGALRLGGTITGEHGVGSLKRAFLSHEMGSVAVGVQSSIKNALDPSGILNPGKMV